MVRSCGFFYEVCFLNILVWYSWEEGEYVEINDYNLFFRLDFMDVGSF